MFTKLKLERFKNFERAELLLGPLTLCIGANASGKSNLRDAFRFLHGISRGYTLVDIMGQKWIEGGVLQWQGIRGGNQEITYRQTETFTLMVEFGRPTYIYSIEINPGSTISRPRIVKESFYGPEGMIFDSHPSDNPPHQKDIEHLIVRIQGKKSVESFIANQPVLTQINQPVSSQIRRGRRGRRSNRKKSRWPDVVTEAIELFVEALGSIQFLDLNPEAMRLPSLPGQTILGDRGENLSSVLQAICEDPQRKAKLIDWIRELTPMDAQDFEFPADQAGRILVSLVEEDGQKTSAYSASDGTLRFLGMIAALLGPEPADFYFFEELENGLHPARLHLLLQLIERQVTEENIQIVATSHSPPLLRFLSPASLEYATLVYRLPGDSDARIKRILDIPDARRVIDEYDIANLYESGWFEDAMIFDEAKIPI